MNAGWAALLLGLTGVWAARARDGAAELLAVVPVAAGLVTVLVLRHRYPRAMLLLALAVGGLQLLLDVPLNPLTLAIMVIIFTNAALPVRWASRLALGMALLAPPVAAARWPPRAMDPADALVDTFFLTAFGVLAWVLGYSVRHRRAYEAELADRSARLARERTALARERQALDRERQARAEAAVTVERSRIARELHDVVAHSVSVMVVQADGAVQVMDDDPARARGALTAISATGRQALAELRRVLDVLRPSGETAAHDAYLPQPGLAQVAELVEGARQGGLAVDFRTEGTPGPLPSSVELTVYHLVREALRNSAQHAGPRTGVRVRLRHDEDELALLVEDDGSPPPDPPRPGARTTAPPAKADTPSRSDEGWATGREAPDSPGHGLLRMRERVHMAGGSLTAGPRPGGGFRLQAVFPLQPEH